MSSNTLSGLFHTANKKTRLYWLLFHLPKLLKVDLKWTTKCFTNCYFESIPTQLNLSGINGWNLLLSISVH